jgi:hypothetical protein
MGFQACRWDCQRSVSSITSDLYLRLPCSLLNNPALQNAIKFETSVLVDWRKYVEVEVGIPQSGRMAAGGGGIWRAPGIA